MVAGYLAAIVHLDTNEHDGAKHDWVANQREYAFPDSFMGMAKKGVAPDKTYSQIRPSIPDDLIDDKIRNISRQFKEELSSARSKSFLPSFFHKNAVKKTESHKQANQYFQEMPPDRKNQVYEIQNSLLTYIASKRARRYVVAPGKGPGAWHEISLSEYIGREDMKELLLFLGLIVGNDLRDKFITL
jgi:hypothetical protein